MGFRTNLREAACSEAKRCDSKYVQDIHLFIAFLRIYKNDENTAAIVRKKALVASGRIVYNGNLVMLQSVEDQILKCIGEEESEIVFSELANQILTDHVEDPIPSEKFEDIMKEFDKLIGLQEVKARLNDVLNMHRANQKRVARGMAPVDVTLHLVFTGDPGTGKTTVARLVARLYKSIGILQTGQLVEVGRVDLVASFVGQTAPKVQAVIAKSLGGVLFIDEAYVLDKVGNHQNDFGAEAVATLIKAMEEQRGELVVIAAGYRKEMESFIQSNPGLRSRFSNFINFPNYSADELVQVFEGLCDRSHIRVNANVVEQLRDHFSSVNTGGELGNARYVRNIFELMFANMASRSIKSDAVLTIALEEFEFEDIPNFEDKSVQERMRNPIGFI